MVIINTIEIARALIDDSPFCYHRPNELATKILVGKRNLEFLKRFTRFYFVNTISDSIMTAVTSEPGIGKTHFFHYLERNTRKKSFAIRSPVIIIDLKDIKMSLKTYLNELVRNDRYLKFLSKHSDIKIQTLRSYSTQDLIQLMNKTCSSLRANGVTIGGIIVCVDEIDEYVRKQSGEVIKEFLGQMRQLMGVFPCVCIILSLTEDILDHFIHALKEDKSLGRRFSFIYDESGQIFHLRLLDEYESIELVSSYLTQWRDKHSIHLHKVHEKIKNQDLFPFTRKSLELIVRAADYRPGWIGVGCTVSIMDKAYYFMDTPEKKLKSLIITENDVAWSLKKFKRFFPRLEGTLKEEVDSHLKGPRMKFEIKTVEKLALQQFTEFLSPAYEALKNYVYSLYQREIDIILNNVAIRHTYDDFEVFYKLDLLIRFGNTKKNQTIGVQLINCHQKIKPQELDACKVLGTALKNEQIQKAIILRISDNFDKGDDLKPRYVETKGIPNHRWRKTYFYEYISGIDYNKVLIQREISLSDIWKIIGVDIHTDQLTMKNEYIMYMDDHFIRLKETIERTLALKPPKIGTFRKITPKEAYSPGDS